jgi:hypothetical protein
MECGVDWSARGAALLGFIGVPSENNLKKSVVSRAVVGPKDYRLFSRQTTWVGCPPKTLELIAGIDPSRQLPHEYFAKPS